MHILASFKTIIHKGIKNQKGIYYTCNVMYALHITTSQPGA